MATDTFLRLPREKQERFLRAAWNEFTSCPYESVSINRIIQAAQVSRGSFYQYFSGKHDLFIYLLKNLIDTASRLFLAQMTVHQDDIFEAILGMYDMIVWQAASPKPDQPQAPAGPALPAQSGPGGNPVHRTAGSGYHRPADPRAAGAPGLPGGRP